jgi:hypothetical protein
VGDPASQVPHKPLAEVGAPVEAQHAQGGADVGGLCTTPPTLRLLLPAFCALSVGATTHATPELYASSQIQLHEPRQPENTSEHAVSDPLYVTHV